MNGKASEAGAIAGGKRSARPSWARQLTTLGACLWALACVAGCNGTPGVKQFGDGAVAVTSPDGAADARDAKPLPMTEGGADVGDASVKPDGLSDSGSSLDAGALDGAADQVPSCTGAPDGTACDDGNKCTQRDTCQAGQCLGENPVLCAAADSCHKTGVCQPETGLCDSPPQADGTACDDGNKCTHDDACKAGVCAGAAVVCQASDQCHSAGTCDAATGTCSNPAKAEGATCDDANKCTHDDVCAAGVCAGVAVVCQASDQCHVAGACEASTGACSNPAKGDGVSCDDGDACTRTDTCQAGACKGANLPGCMSSPACKAKNECVEVTDCTGQADGTICDDGNACTQKDVCMGGQCLGTTPVVCKALDQCHDAGTCNTQTGVCANPAKADGASCEDGNQCTATDTCKAGVCVAGPTKSCMASDSCHSAGTCNPSNGMCSNPSKTDGAGCDDGNKCTQTDTCSAGRCVGSNLKTCTASDICHDPGTCDPTSGICSNPAVPNNPPKGCDDNNKCTSGESCQNGTCMGGTVLTCPTMACQTAGACDRTSGQCSYTPVADGTGNCSDNDPCTQTDRCMGGKCVGSNPKMCAASDQCHEAGTCDRASGNCSNPPSTNGKMCSDGKPCTSGDSCRDGLCVPTGTTSCTTTDPCLAGRCDATKGCVNDPVQDGTDCSGGDKCNVRTCTAGVCGPPTTPNCATNDVCLIGSCDKTMGCVKTPAPDKTTCSNGKACTVGQSCLKGVCQGGSPPACNVTKDGCCGVNANGALCNAVADPDCPATCGNGVLEPGEACDTAITGGAGLCPTPNTCVTIGCDLAALSGTACGAQCARSTIGTCSGATSDGCCASGCTAVTDVDCPPTNDLCPNALDISKGGVFPVDITAATKTNLPPQKGCGTASADVFYTFTLTQTEHVYLDVLGLTAPATTKVGLALELYTGGCPTTATAGPCGLAANNDRCGGVFPTLSSSRAGQLGNLVKGTYTLVVRQNGEAPGHWQLRFDHVPVVCAANELTPGQIVSATCEADHVRPGCAVNPGAPDSSFFIVKCPGATVTGLTTCPAAGTAGALADLSATAGTLSVNANGLCAPASDGGEVACQAAATTRVCAGGATINVAGPRSGLVVVTANARLADTGAPTCTANSPATITYPAP